MFVIALVLLLGNGRPIGAPDPSGAAGWLLRGALALAGAAVEIDATGAAIVGKLLAAACAALAAVAVFAAAARRQLFEHARWAALVLVSATTLAAAAQAWSGEAPATAAVAIALWLLARGESEDDGRVAARAGLPLALAASFEPAAAALALALGIAALVRWREIGPSLLSWAAGGLLAGIGAVVASAAHAGAVPVVRAGEGLGPAALLLSPAKGALVFTPVALVGLAGLLRAWWVARGRQRWDQPSGRLLPLACAAGVLAQFASVAALGGWDQGVSWGPRLLAPAWPLLLVFLAEGMAATKIAGVALVTVSVAVQALGAFAYDGRWDRLQRNAQGALTSSAAWDVEHSPIVFQWHERIARPALLGLERRRLVVREYALVREGPSGSFVSFGSGRLQATGADATMEALRLENGAQAAADVVQLRQCGDAIAFRVRQGARPRRLELRVVGRGQGTIGLAEAAFWNAPRWRERPVSGPFRLRFAYAFSDAHAPDLSVVLRSGGPVAIESVALVPPGDPEDVIRLP